MFLIFFCVVVGVLLVLFLFVIRNWGVGCIIVCCSLVVRKDYRIWIVGSDVVVGLVIGVYWV